MEDNFKLEIISPEKIIFSDDAKMVTIPSYEGDMSILKNHISIITFLRPGIIKVKKNDGNLEEFFVEEGTIEYFNDSLVILSTSTINLKDLSKEFLDNLNKNTENKISKTDITDEDRYLESITERQDICLNMTKMSDEEIMKEIELGGKKLNEMLEVGLNNESLVKSKGYKSQRISKELDAPENTNISSLGDKLSRPKLNTKKIKRIRNDVSFNYSQTDFKFEE